MLLGINSAICTPNTLQEQSSTGNLPSAEIRSMQYDHSWVVCEEVKKCTAPGSIYRLGNYCLNWGSLQVCRENSTKSKVKEIHSRQAQGAIPALCACGQAAAAGGGGCWQGNCWGGHAGIWDAPAVDATPQAIQGQKLKQNQSGTKYHLYVR